MLKQYTLILGLGLTLSLGACSQAETNTKTSEPVQQTQAPKAKPQDGARQDRRQRPANGREGRALSEFMYASCDGLAVGDTCSVETPRGTREGVCFMREGDERSLCRPKRPQGGQGDRGERPQRPQQ
ncbi:MAG: hypothetical protein ABJ275_07125 [Maricaulaceae bacterium]